MQTYSSPSQVHGPGFQFMNIKNCLSLTDVCIYCWLQPVYSDYLFTYCFAFVYDWLIVNEGSICTSTVCTLFWNKYSLSDYYLPTKVATSKTIDWSLNSVFVCQLSKLRYNSSVNWFDLFLLFSFIICILERCTRLGLYFRKILKYLNLNLVEIHSIRFACTIFILKML